MATSRSEVAKEGVPVQADSIARCLSRVALVWGFEVEVEVEDEDNEEDDDVDGEEAVIILFKIYSSLTLLLTLQ